MSYSTTAREHYQKELAGLKEAGLFKEERYIRSPQGADIEVEFPVGADGRNYETRNRYALCRCGASRNKPFCDAAHVNTGYQDGLGEDD